MKNWEKYEDDIRKLLANNEVAFGFIDGKIRECCEIPACERCKFIVNNQCNYNRFIWLYEEAKPTLTKRERAFCEAIDSTENYIARNKSGTLLLHFLRPDKKEFAWMSKSAWLPLNKYLFTFITWEEEKPWSIEELLKLEVE